MIHALGRDWYSANEVPSLWPDVTPEMVRQWAFDGKLNGHRIGRSVYYDENDLTEVEYLVRNSGAGRPRVAGKTGLAEVPS